MHDPAHKPWNTIFHTPEDLYDKMLEYLNHVKVQNSNRIVYIDVNDGEEYENIHDAMAVGVDEDDLKPMVIKVPLEEKIRPTMFGFSAYCNMSRTSLWKYSKLDDDFADVVDWFKNILQADLEQILINPMTRNTNGPKFVAVNNYGWHDKSEVNHSGAQPVTFVDDLGEDE